jgi:integrase
VAYTFSLYKRGGIYYARIFLEGEGGADHRVSTGVKVGDRPRVSEVQAQAVAKSRADALLASRPSEKVTVERDSIAAVAERLLAQKTVDGRRDLAVYALAFNIDKHVAPYFGEGRSVTTIRRADLEAFKAHMAKKYKPTTINNALTAIRQILKHAAYIDEMIESVPVVKNVPVDKVGSGRALTKQEAATLLDAVDDPEAREWLIFVANTGLRRTEALSIRWSWIDWRAKVLRVPAEFRKGGKPQIAPTHLNPTALRILRARQKRKAQPADDRVWWHVKQTRYDRARNAAAEKTKLGRVRSHDLRHTAGSLAHASGASGPEVRDLLGHSTLAMVSRYGHSYADRLAKVAKAVEIAVPVCQAGGRKRDATRAKGNAMGPTNKRRTRARRRG